MSARSSLPSGGSPRDLLAGTAAVAERAGIRGRGMTGRGPPLAGITDTGPLLSAGVITADLTRLGAEIEVIRGRAHWAHVDVMDGVFCPQLTVGPSFVAAVASTGVPVDAHLMVEEPRRLVPEIAAAGAAVI